MHPLVVQTTVSCECHIIYKLLAIKTVDFSFFFAQTTVSCECHSFLPPKYFLIVACMRRQSLQPFMESNGSPVLESSKFTTASIKEASCTLLFQETIGISLGISSCGLRHPSINEIAICHLRLMRLPSASM